MYNWFKAGLLDVLKVPPEPDDPLGAGESLLVFRAAKNYFKYKLLLWAIPQGFALLGLVIAIVALGAVTAEIDEPLLKSLLLVAEVLTVLFTLLQIPFSLAILRLDYEMRWYKVTDQSLRIREGVLHVREMTMTFANIQNISITQGPIQRLLGIADLKVQSAGGGGRVSEKGQHQGFGLDMHTGYFRGVDNAEHIRELMRQRLKASRDSGLGDPDQLEEEAASASPSTTAELKDVLAGLRSEAAAFRQAAERLSV